MLLLASAVLAATPCGTLDLGARAAPLPLKPLAPPPAGDKAEQDALGLPHSVLSTNFAVRWPEGVEFTEAEAAYLLDKLEAGWSYLFDTWGYPTPRGSDTYLFNVYWVDGSSELASGMEGIRALYFPNPTGLPYILLNGDYLGGAEVGRATVLHELFHAAQDASGSPIFERDTDDDWFVEASANWAAGAMDPTATSQLAHSPYYLVQPHDSLRDVESTGDGPLNCCHEYGASVFVQYLSEHLAGPEWVHALWLDPSLEDVLAEVDALEPGFGSHFLDFAQRNVTLDYEDGDLIAYYLTEVLVEPSAAIAAEVAADGTGGWQTIPDELLPEGPAYNVIRLDWPNPGSYTFSFRGDAEGDRGNPAEWAVGIVREHLDGATRSQLEVVDGEASVTYDGLETDRAVYLVVAATAREGRRNRYGYEFDITWEPPRDDGAPSPEPAALCAAASRETALAWLVAMGMVLGGRRRRCGS